MCCVKNPRIAAELAGGVRVVQGFSEEPDDKTVVLMEELSQRPPWIWPDGVRSEPRGLEEWCTSAAVILSSWGFFGERNRKRNKAAACNFQLLLLSVVQNIAFSRGSTWSKRPRQHKKQEEDDGVPQGPWHQLAAAEEQGSCSGDTHLEPEAGVEGWAGLPAFQPFVGWSGRNGAGGSSWRCVIPPTVMDLLTPAGRVWSAVWQHSPALVEEELVPQDPGYQREAEWGRCRDSHQEFEASVDRWAISLGVRHGGGDAGGRVLQQEDPCWHQCGVELMKGKSGNNHQEPRTGLDWWAGYPGGVCGQEQSRGSYEQEEKEVMIMRMMKWQQVTRIACLVLKQERRGALGATANLLSIGSTKGLYGYSQQRLPGENDRDMRNSILCLMAKSITWQANASWRWTYLSSRVLAVAHQPTVSNAIIIWLVYDATSEEMRQHEAAYNSEKTYNLLSIEHEAVRQPEEQHVPVEKCSGLPGMQKRGVTNDAGTTYCYCNNSIESMECTFTIYTFYGYNFS